MSATPDVTKTPYYVYFISAGSSPIKIGISAEPDKRQQQLQTSHFQPLVLFLLILCYSKEAALQIEHLYHVHFAHRRAKGEWFKITPIELGTDDPLGFSKSVQGYADYLRIVEDCIYGGRPFSHLTIDIRGWGEIRQEKPLRCKRNESKSLQTQLKAIRDGEAAELKAAALDVDRVPTIDSEKLDKIRAAGQEITDEMVAGHWRWIIEKMSGIPISERLYDEYKDNGVMEAFTWFQEVAWGNEHWDIPFIEWYEENKDTAEWKGWEDET